MEKYLTPLEASEILKIKKSTVYDMIKRGDLTASKMGKQLRIPESELMRLMSVSTTSTEQHAPAAAGSGISVSGQDIILDILCTKVKNSLPGAFMLRSDLGSYNGLYAMYQGQVTVASAHLWDMETDSYNLPFISRLLPGIDVAVYHIAKRDVGIYVSPENPKNIRSIKDFARDDISIVNRENGSGIRVLTDSLLLKNGIPSGNINGYDNVVNSHFEAAMAVASGRADCAFGNRTALNQVKNLDFIFVKKESYDIVIRTRDLNIPEIQCLTEIISSPEYIREISALEGYDTSHTGRRLK